MKQIDLKEFLTEDNIWFTRAFYKFISLQGRILTFRREARVIGPVQKQAYKQSVREFMQQMRPGGELEEVMPDPESFFNGEVDEEFYSNAVIQSFRDVSNMTNSAALIYSHSVFDSFLKELLTYCHSREEQFFKKSYLKYVFSVNQLKTSKIEELIQMEQNRQLKELQRKSLPKKCEILNKICSPNLGGKRVGRITYDRDRIRSIDGNRHAIVHNFKLSFPDETVEDDLDYIFGLGFYFIVAMNKRYDLKLIPDLIRDTLIRDTTQ